MVCRTGWSRRHGCSPARSGHSRSPPMPAPARSSRYAPAAHSPDRPAAVHDGPASCRCPGLLYRRPDVQLPDQFVVVARIPDRATPAHRLGRPHRSERTGQRAGSGSDRAGELAVRRIRTRRIAVGRTRRAGAAAGALRRLRTPHPGVHVYQGAWPGAIAASRSRSPKGHAYTVVVACSPVMAGRSVDHHDPGGAGR